MNYRKIISTAWDITKDNKGIIKWYALLPAVLATLIGILEVLYQVFSFKKSGIFGGVPGTSFAYEIFASIANLLKTNTSLGIFLIVIIVLILIINFTIPPLAKAGIIQLLTRYYNGQKFMLRDGVKHGSKSYWRMLGYESTIKDFSLLLVFSIFSFILRHYGLPVLDIILIPTIILAILSIVLGILFTYSEYFIVIDELGFKDAMWKSVRMSAYFWEHTVLLIIFIIIIGFRVIINTFFILLIPTIIIALTSLVNIEIVHTIGVIIGVIFAIAAFVLASYINAVIDVWIYAVWIITFLKLNSYNSNKEISEIDENNLSEDIKETKDMDVTTVELE